MSSKEAEKQREFIIARLRLVIDPETGADVVRMHLVEDLKVTGSGRVSYVFRPSSPVCPLAVYLVQQIKQAVAQVPGVVSQTITVKGYVAAEQLTMLINKEE
jgi:metal-sulfur cluster biosynthetic enzyme